MRLLALLAFLIGVATADAAVLLPVTGAVTAPQPTAVLESTAGWVAGGTGGSVVAQVVSTAAPDPLGGNTAVQVTLGAFTGTNKWETFSLSGTLAINGPQSQTFLIQYQITSSPSCGAPYLIENTNTAPIKLYFAPLVADGAWHYGSVTPPSGYFGSANITNGSIGVGYDTNSSQVHNITQTAPICQNTINLWPQTSVGGTALGVGAGNVMIITDP